MPEEALPLRCELFVHHPFGWALAVLPIAFAAHNTKDDDDDDNTNTKTLNIASPPRWNGINVVVAIRCCRHHWWLSVCVYVCALAGVFVCMCLAAFPLSGSSERVKQSGSALPFCSYWKRLSIDGKLFQFDLMHARRSLIWISLERILFTDPDVVTDKPVCFEIYMQSGVTAMRVAFASGPISLWTKSRVRLLHLFHA